MVFDVTLHLATLLAVLLYFRTEILHLIVVFWVIVKERSIANVARSDARMIGAIVLGTLPAGIIGLLFKDFFEGINSPLFVVVTLLAGSIFFFIAEKMYTNRKQIDLSSGFLIGCFQVLALFPGFSRSGSTIGGGLILGVERSQVAQFSFIMAIPLIAGAWLVSVHDSFDQIRAMTVSDGLSLFVGWLLAFIVGYFAIAFLMKYIKTHTLLVFAWYRIVLAGIVLGVVFF